MSAQSQDIMGDLKNVFDTVKTIFDTADVAIKPEILLGGSAPHSKPLLGPEVCLKACEMDRMADSLEVVKDTMVALQKTLLTFEYCMLVLTVIIGVSMIALVLTAMHYSCSRGKKVDVDPIYEPPSTLPVHTMAWRTGAMENTYERAKFTRN